MEIANRTVDEIIEALGGDVKAAEFFEITRQGVAKFRKKNHIPNARLLHLKAARPDLFEPKVPERRSRDQRMGDRRNPDLFESTQPVEREKAL